MVSGALQQSFNGPDRGEVNAFFNAVNCGDNATVAKFLDQYSAYVDIRHPEGGTSLICTAKCGRGYTGTAKLLLEHGADINRTDECGNTPLILAAMNGHSDLVTLLLEKGADAAAKQYTGKTALIMAQQYRQAGTAAALVECANQQHGQQSKNTPSQKELDSFIQVTASCGDDAGVIDFLDKYPAAVNEKSTVTDMGMTALTAAASYNHPRTVKLLLERGAGVNEKNGWGDTALIYAALHDYTDTMQLLLENGADIDAKRQDGKTALAIAQGGNMGGAVVVLTRWAEKQRAQWLKETDFSKGLKRPIPASRPFKPLPRKV